MNRYGSRKFIVAVMALIGTHWMLVEHLIVGADYKAIVLGIVGLYAAGNVGAKAVERKDAAP